MTKYVSLQMRLCMWGSVRAWETNRQYEGLFRFGRNWQVPVSLRGILLSLYFIFWCLCTCDLLIAKTRPAAESFIAVAFEGCARVVHTNALVLWIKVCVVERRVEGKKNATEVRKPRALSKAPRRKVRDPSELERSYRLLWSGAVGGCSGGRHPSVWTPAPAAHTPHISEDPQVAPMYFPLRLPPEWRVLRQSPSHCTSPVQTCQHVN